MTAGRLAGLALSLLCLIAPAAHASAPRYRVVSLGVPPGYQASYATCLNDRGQVAGDLVSRAQISMGRNKGTTAFLWDRGHMHLLPSFPSPYSATHEEYDAVASGINNHGLVVGTLSYFFDGAWMGTDLQAVLWERGRLRKIPRLGSGRAALNQNAAIAINDAGQVAGTADDDFMTDSEGVFPHIFLYSHDHIADLGPGCATALNQSGQITGYALLNKSGRPTSDHVNSDLITQVRAILCGQDGKRSVLGGGYALTLNDSGNVIGTDEAAVNVGGPPRLRTQTTDALSAGTITARKVFAHDHKFTDIIGPQKTKAARTAQVILWRTGQGRSRAVPLPIRWLPQAINAGGQMVGGHSLWQAGRSYDLNHLIGRRSGWKIVQATALNNHSQIAGWGYCQGKPRAFLLTPQP